MALLDLRGGFLYQHRSDLFPQGFLTETESALWELYYYEKLQNQPKR